MNIKSFRFDVVRILACITTIGCLLLGSIFAGPLPVSADSSGCSLEVESGTVEVQDFGFVTWRKVVGDTSLQAGARVITASDGSAVITFLDGSSMELNPDTYILIQQVDYSPDKSVVTIISQFWGRTWNRVVKMIDSGSKYEIFTPSCHAAVRGTYFMVDASLTGATTTQTFQGLVAVDSQSSTVLVPPEHSVSVDRGKAPPTPSKSQDQGINNKQDTGKENGQSKENISSQNKSNAGGNSSSSNAGGNSGSSNAGGSSSSSNAGGNSGSSNAGGNSGSSNAGGNSGSSNAGGNSGSSNAGGNSGSSNAGGNSGSSNAGGNSGSSNAGGNSGSSNAGGSSSSSNAGGNSGSSNAGGNSGSSGSSGSSNAGGNSGSSNAGGNSGSSGSSNAGGNSGKVI